MRWLFRLFFLERLPQWSRKVRPLQSFSQTQGDILYKSEIESLVMFLQGQLQERVYYKVDAKGRVIIGTVGETVAHISLCPKGKVKRAVYIAVRLEDGYEAHKAWFQLAFVCHVVRFRKPILTLIPAWRVGARGQ